MASSAATTADVEAVLQRDLSTNTYVSRLIEFGTATVATYLRGMTVPSGSESVTLTGNGEEFLWLPKFPVNDVTAVSIEGTALTSDEWAFTVLGRLERRTSLIAADLDYSASQRLRLPDGVEIVVTYDYGWGAASAVPDEIRMVVAELAAGRIVNPDGVRQEQIGDRMQTFGGFSSGDGLTDVQKRSHSPWRRFAVTSARVRTL